MPSMRTLLVVALILPALACGKDPATAKIQHLKSGDSYAAAGKLPEAIVEYRNAIKYDLLFGEAHAKLADALSKSGKALEAYQEYIRAADLLPADIDAQIKAGGALLLAGQFEDARGRADKALALDPSNVDAYLLRGRALAGMNDVNGAIAQVNNALKMDPERSIAYSDLAILQLAQGNSEKAEQAFRHAVELAPKSSEARVMLGNYYWRIGKTDLAERVFKEALAMAPGDVLVNRQLGYLYVSLNRGADAEAPLKLVAENSKDPNARLLLAEYYRTSGKQPLALQVLDELAKDPAMFAMARARKGAILYASGQKREAYDAVEEVLKKDAKNSVALLQKASFLMADGDLDQALKLAQVVAASDPQLPNAPLAIGRIQVARGEFDEAVTAYNEVLKLAPKYIPVQLELARLSLLENRPADALSLATSVLAAEPRSADAMLFKARALMMQGNLAAADEPMKLLATTFPNSPAVQAQLGTLYVQKRDFNAARAAYERALKSDPVNFEALTKLTALDFSEKKGETARARIDAVLTSQQKTTPLLLLAARTYNDLGDHAKAEQTANEILERAPSSFEGYVFLAQLYASQNRLPEAITRYQEIAKRKPKLAAVPIQIGILLELSNKRQEAAKWYEQALSIDKNAAIAANNLAMIYVDTGGNLDMAGQLAQTAKQQLPNSPEVSDTLGWVYYKKGQAALAIAALKEAVAQQPQNAVYHYHLGLAYAKSGAKVQARNSLEQALKISPTFEGADDARQVLKSLQG
jgi:putative PEP-CTERM system TPR-repeat lipoprotein